MIELILKSKNEGKCCQFSSLLAKIRFIAGEIIKVSAKI